MVFRNNTRLSTLVYLEKKEKRRLGSQVFPNYKEHNEVCMLLTNIDAEGNFNSLILRNWVENEVEN